MLFSSVVWLRKNVASTCPDDALQAFRHSVELNPSFGPPYAHLIELTLGERGDSARAAQLNAAYARIAPGADNLSWGRLTLALAFGEAEARADALAVLDTLPVPVVAQLAKYLNEPRFRAAQEQVLEIITRRRSEPNPYRHPFASSAYIARGELSAAVANALQHDACPLATIYWSYLLGSHLSDEAEATLRHKTPRSDSCQSLSFVFRAAYAIDRGWWADADREQAGLNAAIDQQLAAGDSLGARQLRLASEALRGHRLAHEGDAAAGIRVLESVQPQLRTISDPVRWWLGTMLLQSGRVADARPYFASFWVSKSMVAASYYLGQIDEKLGRVADARVEYERFANGWRNADSDVQPRLVDARARAAALARAGLGR